VIFQIFANCIPQRKLKKQLNITYTLKKLKNNFVRLSDDLGLYELEDGRKRPIYVYRHSFISGRRKKGVDTNVLALHSNNSPQMINQHYSVLSDDHLLEIHNQVFPERKKSTKN
jgi:hypothetical protein